MGAKVTGSDLTPELFDDARRRAVEAGVEVDWVEADAEALPFPDNSFDRVFSTFGHMFAPLHAVAASEMARVCRPDGQITTSTYAPEGSAGTMFKTLAKYLPPPPDGVESPLAWGTEDHAREIYEPLGLELKFSHATNYVRVPKRVRADGVHVGELRPTGHGQGGTRRPLAGAGGRSHGDDRGVERGHRR